MVFVALLYIMQGRGLVHTGLDCTHYVAEWTPYSMRTVLDCTHLCKRVLSRAGGGLNREHPLIDGAHQGAHPAAGSRESSREGSRPWIPAIG